MGESIYPITVTYWRGTQQFSGKATTVRGAMRIAARNSNAYSPTFRAASGQKLHPIHNSDGKLMGLAPASEDVCYA